MCVCSYDFMAEVNLSVRWLDIRFVENDVAQCLKIKHERQAAQHSHILQDKNTQLLNFRLDIPSFLGEHKNTKHYSTILVVVKT